MEHVSEFESSTDDSTRSSFWESSTLDDSTETGSELSSIHSGSEPEEAGLLQPRKASAVKRVSTFAKSSPAKRIRLESKSLSSSSDEETSNKDGDEGDKTFQRRRQGGRGGRGGRRGREGQEASRGQGLSSGRRTTRDRRGRGSSRRKSQTATRIPRSAVPISVPDIEFHPPEEFCPLREPGPYLPAGMTISALSLFELFF